MTSKLRLLVAVPPHVESVRRLRTKAGTAGILVTDPRAAALAVEHGATIRSADTTFGRRAGVKWQNPLPN